MSLFDSLLGRTKPVKSKLEQLFAISTGYVSLTMNQGLEPSRRAGVSFRPVSSSNFAFLEKDLRELLRVSGQETNSKIKVSKDSFGYQWVVVEDDEFEDLVSTIHMVSLSLQEQGYADQLLAAVFKFFDDRQPVYWIYNYKRGTFYPFVPAAKGRERDNDKELRLRAVMEREMPVEPELERWYPLWDNPI